MTQMIPTHRHRCQEPPRRRWVSRCCWLTYQPLPLPLRRPQLQGRCPEWVAPGRVSYQHRPARTLSPTTPMFLSRATPSTPTVSPSPKERTGASSEAATGEGRGRGKQGLHVTPTSRGSSSTLPRRASHPLPEGREAPVFVLGPPRRRKTCLVLRLLIVCRISVRLS